MKNQCRSEYVERWFVSHKTYISTGLGIILNGVLMLITPWVTNLPGLIITTAITGLMFGFLESGTESCVWVLVWSKWKSEKSNRCELWINSEFQEFFWFWNRASNCDTCFNSYAVFVSALVGWERLKTLHAILSLRFQRRSFASTGCW